MFFTNKKIVLNDSNHLGESKMCGIVGFTGTHQAAPILLNGLSKLVACIRCLTPMWST